MADRTESIILDVEIDTQESVESINSLLEANKRLRKERNDLHIQTEAGAKRAQQINALIDANTEKIKSNVSALEKQKINIGNYRSALDGVHPALGKVGEGLEGGTEGFKAMTMQALRFIATPVGAILAALVATFTLLKAAISTNNEVLDKFENVTNAIGIVLEIFINRVGKLGEALLALAQGNFSEAIDKTSQAFSGMGDQMARAVEEGQKLLDMERDLEDAQRDLTVATAKQENQIKALVVASKNRNLTLDESEAKLKQALELERTLVAERERLALQDLEVTAMKIANTEEIVRKSGENIEQFAERLRKNGQLSDDQVDGVIEKLVALESARGSSLAFQEKVENQLAAIAEKRAKAIEELNKRLAEQAANERAIERARSGGIGETTKEDPIVQANLDRAIQVKDINERLAKDIAGINKKAEQDEKDRIEKNLKIHEMAESAKIDIAQDTLSVVSSMLEEGSAEYKAVSSLQALISTYTSAQKSYESLASIPYVGPALGTAAAAAAVVAGLARVAQINGIQFAEGGWTGPGGKWDVAGVVHADEYVTPKRVVNNPMAQPHLAALERMRLAPYADGGMVTRSISAPINQAMEMANALKNLPPIEVSAVEMTKVQNKVKVKQNISKI